MNFADISISLKEFVGAIFMFAFVWYELKAIRRAINRLEDKVEKHNSFDRRIIKLETMLEMAEKEKEHNAKI